MRIVLAAAMLLAGITPAFAQHAPAIAQATTPAVAPSPPPAKPQQPASTRPTGDGPSAALNKFVMKEITQCRTMDSAYERRACCEKVMHANACAE